MSFIVSEVRFTRARPEQEMAGLLGFVRFVVNDGLQVDGVSLRRDNAGSTYLSYPARADRRGGLHPYLRPMGDAPRRDIEEQVFAALGLAEELS